MDPTIGLNDTALVIHHYSFATRTLRAYGIIAEVGIDSRQKSLRAVA
jgi:hypothetical protein